MLLVPAYAITVFIASYLLFQVQPLIAKYILPWFGGGPGVWTTCMLFFQVVLLGGYAYAHWVSQFLKPRVQVVVHCALVAISLALLPITPANSWKPIDAGNPTLRILELLAASLGLPYLLLSSTGPLMQSWFSRTHPGTSPYRLYALSNIASFLALISYPFFVESHFTRKVQALVWGWGLGGFAVACAICMVRVWRVGDKTIADGALNEAGGSRNQAGNQNITGKDAPNTSPQMADRLLWLFLPACASVLLLAVTNKICQDVAVIPFLWILPLALYLLSFVFCFDAVRWYRRFPFMVALVAAMAGICWVQFQGNDISLFLVLSIYCCGLFVCCMVCHGELYALRPDSIHLTSFYLMIATGGALGGVFVAVVAPLIFKGYYELHWGLLFCAVLFAVTTVHTRAKVPAPENQLPYSRFRPWVENTVVALGLISLAIVLWRQANEQNMDKVFSARNFYGVLTISERARHVPAVHNVELYHGRTRHGMQFLNPKAAPMPTLYYGEPSGAGLAMFALPAGHRRVGLVGLGVGTLATYSRPGDYFHYYEINPQVVELANSKFTYLSNATGTVEVSLGDARLSLEREPTQHYDMIVLDAFNSDAIPVHLLTKEAFEVYQRHLKMNGIIAIHASNNYLDLEPVLLNVAREFKFGLAVIESTPPKEKWWLSLSSWILLSSSTDFISSPLVQSAARPPKLDWDRVPLWTDDFSSLYQILK